MDYLVNLSLLTPKPDLDARMAAAGVTIRRPLAPEARLVTEWVAEKFGKGWASETAVSLTRQPPTCFIATRAKKLVGFACHESIARGFFGPTGVDEAARGLGIGKALLIRTLIAMRDRGNGYAAIGWAGPVDFYARAVGAIPIPGSETGVYAGLLDPLLGPP